MKVRCLYKVMNKVPSAAVRARLARFTRRDEIDELTVGEIYDPVAIVRWKGDGIMVYLQTPDETDFPIPYPLELFEVIESTIRSDWRIKFKREPEGDEISELSFREWIEEPSFLERLYNRDEKAVAQYKAYLEGVARSSGNTPT